MTGELQTVLLYGGIAGLAIPLGAILSRHEFLHSRWHATELRHGIVAFGAGALLAAIALVLVPDATHVLNPWPLSIAFFSGGIVFALIDWYLAKSGTMMGQFVAMLADFLPESLALGALFVVDVAGAKLLALLIAVQNLPEAFSASREIIDSEQIAPKRALVTFSLLAPVGPLAAYIGMSYFSNRPESIALIMIFAAGGILYLMFQDIAPKVFLKKSWLPPFGALMGFFVGILGSMLEH